MTTSAHDQSAIAAFYAALEASFRIASLTLPEDEDDYVNEQWELVNARKARALNDFLKRYRRFFVFECNDVPTELIYEGHDISYGTPSEDEINTFASDVYFIASIFAHEYKLEPFNGEEIVLICDYYGDGSVVNKLTLRVQ